MDIQKAMMQAWFQCHYSLESDDVGSGVKPVSVSRTTLLKELNTFRKGMNWKQWKSQSSLYRGFKRMVFEGSSQPN